MFHGATQMLLVDIVHLPRRLPEILAEIDRNTVRGDLHLSFHRVFPC